MFKKIKKWMFRNRAFARIVFNCYKPFRGAKIKVVSISFDFRTIKVKMPLVLSNKNIMGSQFGGSLYAMTDPFYMYMLMHALGSRYYVWDQQSTIRFISPAYSTVYGVYHLKQEAVDEIVQATATGQKVLFTFKAEIKDTDGKVVAEVEKVVYCRLKKQFRPIES